MTDPLDYWQRREKKSERVYGLSGPNGANDLRRLPTREIPPRAVVTPRARRLQGAHDTADGEGGNANDLEADIAVERDTLETVDPDNPPA